MKKNSPAAPKKRGRPPKPRPIARPEPEQKPEKPSFTPAEVGWLAAVQPEEGGSWYLGVVSSVDATGRVMQTRHGAAPVTIGPVRNFVAPPENLAPLTPEEIADALPQPFATHQDVAEAVKREIGAAQLADLLG